MDELSDIEKSLSELEAAGPLEVYENGQLLPEPAGIQYEVTRLGRRTRIHLWSEHRNLVRTVVRVAERSPERVVLDVEMFGRARPGRLEFVLAGARALRPHRNRRALFLERFRQLLTEQFPDERIQKLTVAADLEHSFSGCYVRGLMGQGQQMWAVIAAGEEESPAAIDGMLAFALIWFDWNRSWARRKMIAGLRLFFPEGRGGAIVHRLQGLSRDFVARQVELYELPPETGLWRARRLDPLDAGNAATWLVPRRETEAALAAAAESVGRITALAPQAIDSVVVPGSQDVAIRFRGLEIARWRNGVVEFGPAGERQPLNERTRRAFEAWIRELETYRSPDSPDRNHPLFRAQPERWLEVLCRHHATAIDPLLIPEHVYTQVAVFSAGDRGVLDLLGLRRDGRLVVMELKAEEDIQLPLQGLDYWLRVRWHQTRDDFRRYGYFPGTEFSDLPPLLYLVGPAIRCHSTLGPLLRFFSPEVEAHWVGVNEHWRAGLRVVDRL